MIRIYRTSCGIFPVPGHCSMVGYKSNIFEHTHLFNNIKCAPSKNYRRRDKTSHTFIRGCGGKSVRCLVVRRVPDPYKIFRLSVEMIQAMRKIKIGVKPRTTVGMKKKKKTRVAFQRKIPLPTRDKFATNESFHRSNTILKGRTRMMKSSRPLAIQTLCRYTR